MKQGLLNKIAELGKELPLNTLDELIDKFGGPEKVSEVSIYVCIHCKKMTTYLTTYLSFSTKKVLKYIL